MTQYDYWKTTEPEIKHTKDCEDQNIDSKDYECFCAD